MTKFLIIRFSSIGDILQCMSIVGGIKEKFPDARIDWVTRSDMASILSIDKRIDKIWPFDKKEGTKGLLKLSKTLSNENYDYVYDAHLNLRSLILKTVLSSKLTKAPKIIVRSKERKKRILLFKFGINRFSWPFIGVNSFREPLKKIGVYDFPSQSGVKWSFSDEIISKNSHLIDDKCVTLVPSANWEMKRWPVESWKNLIKLLPDHNFIILAGPSDHFCDDICQAAPDRVNNLAGKTNLLESCYLASISNIVVSSDTGLMHAADMFSRQTLAIIGPTAFGFPKWDNSKVLEVELPCRPCTKDGRGKCKQSIHQRCMVEITPEIVAKHVDNFFKKKTN
ncbi:MAG: glycosyltransferase family 9 protein [Rikenellaceae bacterium]